MSIPFDAADPPDQAALMSDLCRKSDDERIHHIRSARWIGYPRAIEGLVRLNDLYNWPTTLRMPNMLIVGETNSGKSVLVEHFAREHGSISRTTFEEVPILVMQMPAVATMGRFYRAILDALHAPVSWSARPGQLESLAVSTMRRSRVRILVIDEIHNMFGASNSARLEFLNVLRFLGNELRIPLVGVGTREAYLVIRNDPQLENRFEPFVLSKWSLDSDFLSLLASFEALLPLRRESRLSAPAMATYLLTRSEGTIGELSRLITATAELAIRTGSERIDNETLAASPYTSPSRRSLAAMGTKA